MKTRNLAASTKFNQRLTVKLNIDGAPKLLDIQERRRRITAVHNKARELVSHTSGYVFSVEDDTIIPPDALKRLTAVMVNNRACAFVEGVELGRWGVGYVGAWQCDDIYNVAEIRSVPNLYPVSSNQPPSRIDAGGLYCALIRADIYKLHEFYSNNGLGPDINFGIETRQLGFDNYIEWRVPCRHLYLKMGREESITPREESRVVTMRKENDKKWRVVS